MHDLIPYSVFFEALRNQKRRTMTKWLSRWRFGDAGVVLLFDLDELDEQARQKLESSVLSLIEAQRAKRRGALH